MITFASLSPLRAVPSQSAALSCLPGQDHQVIGLHLPLHPRQLQRLRRLSTQPPQASERLPVSQAHRPEPPRHGRCRPRHGSAADTPSEP